MTLLLVMLIEIKCIVSPCGFCQLWVDNTFTWYILMKRLFSLQRSPIAGKLFFWIPKDVCGFLGPPSGPSSLMRLYPMIEKSICRQLPSYQEKKQITLSSINDFPYITLANQVTSPPLAARESTKVSIYFVLVSIF